MFQFSGFAHLSVYYVFNIVGCPIRISTDQFVCANPRSFSQLITSFFASESLGIPHTPLFCLLCSINLVSKSFVLKSNVRRLLTFDLCLLTKFVLYNILYYSTFKFVSQYVNELLFSRRSKAKSRKVIHFGLYNFRLYRLKLWRISESNR